MTDNQIIKALERCPQHTECCYCNSLEECGNKRILIESVFDLINRQKAIIEKSEKVEHFADRAIETANAEIERLNIELQSMRSAANSYKMHYEKAQTEIKRLQKNIDGLNIFTKNHIKVIRLQAIKEFVEKFAKALSEFDMSSVGLPDYDRGYKDCMTAIEDTIDNIVNKMT